MGGIEDEEPHPKRLKLESGILSNNISYKEFTNHLEGTMDRHLPSNGKEDTIGSKGVIKKVEFVRIITKALYSLGYEKSGALLEEESGIRLHVPLVKLFREQLLDGDWDESLITLKKIGVADEDILKSASFLIMEQKFFELLRKDRVMDALKTLRSEISPMCTDKTRLHKLSCYIVSPSQCNSLVGCHDQGVDGMNPRLKLLEELQKVLPPTIMVPERRLEQLVEQALNVQREACIFHNSLDRSLSLYSDHQCGKDLVPSQSLQVLRAHADDIWYLQFSNNGKYLASSSCDKTTIIWEVHENEDLTLKHTLMGHEKPVMMLAWSPDDSMLLTCGLEEAVRCWNVQSGACVHIYEKSDLGLISCGWFPDGKAIVTGLSDRSVCTWDLDGKELDCWKGQRTITISDIAVTSDSKWIITICKENAILLFDKDTKAERFIEEDHTITSFSLSKDNNFLLLNLINQEIHLWEIKESARCTKRYRGHKRSRFVIRSCFGGLDQAFIASGSEDSQVYIWHRTTRELIQALPGHSGSVNCVTWNPVNPHMMASGSDDHSIRIWGIKGSTFKRKNNRSNGIVHSNGNCK